jgi:hypothetical protein
MILMIASDSKISFLTVDKSIFRSNGAEISLPNRTHTGVQLTPFSFSAEIYTLKNIIKATLITANFEQCSKMRSLS